MEKLNNALAPYFGIIAIILLIAVAVLLGVVIMLNNKQKLLRRRVDFFMRGGKGQSLEEAFRTVFEDNQHMKEQLQKDVKELCKVNEYLSTAYRKIGIVKYNAFPGMAGKISSAVAILNNEDSGIVINTMHGQDGCYTYVKEIMNGKSVNPLTKEDEEAMKIALQMQI